MFAMNSIGAKIDESIYNKRGPCVFKVSGQVYYWIGSLCLLVGEAPRTAKAKCREMDIQEFKIRLYNAEVARGYELPISNTLEAIVFDIGLTSSTDFNVIIQHKDGPAQRINKLHPSYMSLQFPLLFIYR
ncbi:hypothetical protein Tco_1417556 [Tanacetum coccineum]